MRRSTGALAAVAAAVSLATAQDAQFEVASVKLHTSADQRVMMVAQPGGRFVALNVPLRMVIRTAYQLQDDQIVGGPKWLAADRFDIEARAAATGAAINPQLQRCANIHAGFGSLSLRGMPFNQFTPYLSPYVNRVVIDRTGLDQRYDIDLKWTPDPQGLPPGAGPEPPAGDPNAVSIFTAIQEQLGLKLSAARDMVEVLVIDTLEPPTPN